MDFSQFLNSNPDIPKNVKKIIPTTTTQTSSSKTKTTKNTDTIAQLKYNKQDKQHHIQQYKQQQSKQHDNEEFKKFDSVVITYMENSNLNAYKGYFGEIKEIVKNGDSFLIILEAMNYPKLIKFPIGHFKRR